MMKSTANNLIPRPGTADECAQAVMFCVENEFTTGNVIEGAQHSCALSRLLSQTQGKVLCVQSMVASSPRCEDRRGPRKEGLGVCAGDVKEWTYQCIGRR